MISLLRDQHFCKYFMENKPIIQLIKALKWKQESETKFKANYILIELFKQLFI